MKYTIILIFVDKTYKHIQIIFVGMSSDCKLSGDSIQNKFLHQWINNARSN